MMKSPDTVIDAVTDHIIGLVSSHKPQSDDEGDMLYCDFEQYIYQKITKWFKDVETVTLEIDLDNDTIIVKPIK